MVYGIVFTHMMYFPSHLKYTCFSSDCSWKVTIPPSDEKWPVTMKGTSRISSFFPWQPPKRYQKVGDSTMKTSSNYHPGKTYLSFWDYRLTLYTYNYRLTILDGHFKWSFCTSRFDLFGALIRDSFRGARSCAKQSSKWFRPINSKWGGSISTICLALSTVS